MKQSEPTREVIEQAAELRISTNGKTSSLDVKNYLRSLNYWVRQRVVSEALRELASEKNWETKYNGAFNEYSFNRLSAVRDAVISEIEDHSFMDDNPDDADSLREDHGLIDSDILSIIDNLETIMKIDYNIQGINSAMPSTNIGDILTVGDLIHETLVIHSATYGGQKQASIPPVPIAKKPMTTSSSKSAINDSKSPSNNPRVRINIDPKVSVLRYDNTMSGRPDVSSLQDNDWILYQQGRGVSHMRVYDGKYTRDQVRTVYARLMYIRIQETRARRAKNF